MGTIALTPVYFGSPSNPRENNFTLGFVARVQRVSLSQTHTVDQSTGWEANVLVA
jgi:hypothetical protein